MNQYDVAIIGSGAAGSVMAFELARRGLKVVILEKGARQDPETFIHNEFDMVPRLYKNGGLQTTSDNAITIVQGSTVGGSTVINNAIWLRPDLDVILPRWQLRGATIDRPALERAYSDLEEKLLVSPLPQRAENVGTQLFLDACAKMMGVNARRLSNNRQDCLGCGWCNFGCRYNRKTSMLVTFIPWAESKGAIVHDRCQDVRLDHIGDKVKSVSFQREDREQTITADRFVVCAGAIGSSEVLLRSDITQGGRVGRGLHLLLGIVVNGEMPTEINGYDGIGLTCIAEAGPQQVIETFFAPPGAFAITLGGWFETHFERMQNYNRYLQVGVMVGTEPHGQVSIGLDGQTKIDLSLSSDEFNSLKHGVKIVAKILFQAGARIVVPGTFPSLEFQSANDLSRLDDVVKEPADLLLGSAHPQGGNPMSQDPALGVVNNEFRVHGLTNLFVADASVFPTNIWANCQATVMAMAHYASGFVAKP
jgi:choline dehydrogenase-like flavoprotein